MNHQAIYNLYPNVVSIDDTAGAMDANGDSVVIDMVAVNQEAERMQAEQDATQYQRDRELKYPSVGDQLDAILKHLNYRRTQGEDLVQDLDNIVGAWLNIKSRYPKNGSN